MQLTQEIAHLYVGKTLDAHRRLYHYYPITVFERNGEYFYKDSVGVSMRVPDERNSFNRIDFDYVTED